MGLRLHPALWTIASIGIAVGAFAAPPPFSPGSYWEASRGLLGASCREDGTCVAGLACHSDRCQPERAAGLRVATYNVAGTSKGFLYGLSGGEPLVSGIAALICDVDAELIGIQEDYTNFGWESYGVKCRADDAGCVPVAATLLEAIENTCPGRYRSGLAWDGGPASEWTFSYTEGPVAGERADEPAQRFYAPGSPIFMGLNAILWRSDRFELRDAGTVPLCLAPLASDPDVCGPIQNTDEDEMGQDRSLRWMRLRDQHEDRELFVLNTHLQHNPPNFSATGSEAIRVQQADRIISEIEAGFGGSPQHLVLMGDLNARESIPEKVVDEAGLTWVAAGTTLDHILVQELEVLGPYSSMVRLEPWTRVDYCDAYPNSYCSDHASRSTWLRYPITPCSDGLDNDGDGRTDGSDAGCESGSDGSERAATTTPSGWLTCDDGVDNDGDGLTDYPADAGCATSFWYTERTACDDGIDNDADGQTDHPADAECVGGWDWSEANTHARVCGNGFAAALVVPLVVALGSRRGRGRRRPR